MLISVIVSTYNRPDALAEVLRALQDQTDTHFEIVVANDGSSEATHAIISDFQRASAEHAENPTKATTSTSHARPRIIHAWQSDDGFRLSAVRNLGVYASQGDYLIFLDGDCVPRLNFVARHRALAEMGFMVSGSRVLLSEQLTARILSKPSAIPAQRRSIFYWVWQRLSGNANKVVPLLVFPDNSLRHYRKVRWNRIKGCNLGIWRSDYAAVNGCDETFVGWGHEDADLILRLARLGVRRKGGAFSTEVFHLWHKENIRAAESENRKRVEERMKSGVVKATTGLSGHPKPENRIEL